MSQTTLCVFLLSVSLYSVHGNDGRSPAHCNPLHRMLSLGAWLSPADLDFEPEDDEYVERDGGQLGVPGP